MFVFLFYFFFNDTATTEIYTLSLHDALPIYVKDDTIYLDNAIFRKLGKGTDLKPGKLNKAFFTIGTEARDANDYLDRKSTRLNSSHANISYAVFCLKKKINNTTKKNIDNTNR